MQGKVEELFVFADKGKDPRTVEKAVFLAGKGMEGDRHCDGGVRQISIILKEAKDWKEKQESEGLCFRKFKANIVLNDLKPDSLKPNIILRIGEAKFRLTDLKPCYDECPFSQKRKDCILKTHGIFAEVLQGGTACVGDIALIDKK